MTERATQKQTDPAQVIEATSTLRDALEPQAGGSLALPSDSLIPTHLQHALQADKPFPVAIGPQSKDHFRLLEVDDPLNHHRQFVFDACDRFSALYAEDRRNKGAALAAKRGRAFSFPAVDCSKPDSPYYFVFQLQREATTSNKSITYRFSPENKPERGFIITRHADGTVLFKSSEILGEEGFDDDHEEWEGIQEAENFLRVYFDKLMPAADGQRASDFLFSHDSLLKEENQQLKKIATQFEKNFSADKRKKAAEWLKEKAFFMLFHRAGDAYTGIDETGHDLFLEKRVKHDDDAKYGVERKFRAARFAAIALLAPNPLVFGNLYPMPVAAFDAWANRYDHVAHGFDERHPTLPDSDNVLTLDSIGDSGLVELFADAPTWVSQAPRIKFSTGHKESIGGVRRVVAKETFGGGLETDLKHCAQVNFDEPVSSVSVASTDASFKEGSVRATLQDRETLKVCPTDNIAFLGDELKDGSLIVDAQR